MKSHIFFLSFLFLACWGMVACSEQDWADVEQSKGIELSVSCTNVSITRAGEKMPGEVDYNENLIRTLHYFLYPKGKTNVNAVISGKMEIEGGRQGNVVIRVPLNETELNTVLFPRPINDCEVYLIANLPDGLIADNSNTSLNALKNLVIRTDFNTDDPQDSFVMDGQCTATITNRNQTVAAEGEIELKRLAAKFTTRISVASSFKDKDGKVYTPQVEAMKIHLDNAGSNTTLSGTFATEFFDFNQRGYIDTKTEDVDGKSTTYNVFAPFYSYPRKWDYDDNALAMYIMLPWVYQQDGATRTQNCFYKVYPGTMQFDRNSWYNLDLNIGVLGSFSQEEELVTLTGFKYKVVDWRNGYENWYAGVDLETEILSAYYLVVEQNEYVINNRNTFEIPFVTSHECMIWDYNRNTDNNTDNDFKVTQKIFLDSSGKPTNADKDVTANARNGNWITIEGNTIKFNHPLNNDFINTNDYDYSPYTFTFTLCHKNNPDKFQERISIIQKPALSITAHLNSLYEYSNGGTKSGYVYVNGHTANDNINTSTYPIYGGVGDVQSSGNNSNPYMYTIEVSTLPAGSEFILGDSRVKYVFGTDIAEQEKFYPATPVEGGVNRYLTNYYGTIKDTSAENMIAPKFRIASAHGWGAKEFLTYENVFNRAASYQEDGYPAGRWRVPTKAEIGFVYKLYLDDIIPPLFYGTYAYWSATGKFQYNNGEPEANDKSGTSPVRCVYDEWYWENSEWPRMTERGNHPNKYNQFTWGDEIN